MMNCGALTHTSRLAALRTELKRRKLDGFIVPLADEHLSEYVGAYAQRLAWLTGFRGSAGTAIVLEAEAVIFVDGRYTLQVREQVDERLWSILTVPKTCVAAWLGEHAGKGARIGYDPWLHTKDWVSATRAALAERGAVLVAVDINVVDAVWLDRPCPSLAKLAVHPKSLAGRSSSEKRQDIVERLAAKRVDAVVLSALDSIAWTFNVRGSDIEHSPVALAFALVHIDSSADLFVAPDKLTNEVVEHLGSTVRLHSREAFVKHLATLAGRRVAVDPERTVAVILEALEEAGARVIKERDPVLLPKAIKNAAEIAGHRAAQARDGAAFSRFLHWFSIEAPKGVLTELSAAAKLRQFREATGRLRGLSFETISSFGPSGAIIHYRPSEETDRRIMPGSLYLVDSGGQYVDGTTDVTRTITIGAPTAEMRDRFTRALKGHIALARAVFPAGTRGGQLDALARQYLWIAGLDYTHGTSHGVGSYLCVHEGPQRVTHNGDYKDSLMPGMILSNEPGYYKAGEYGIRIENLMVVVKREVCGAELEMLGFETLTFAPLDRALIDLALLTPGERAWIDNYHMEVMQIVGPQLDGSAKTWLQDATRPLS